MHANVSQEEEDPPELVAAREKLAALQAANGQTNEPDIQTQLQPGKQHELMAQVLVLSSHLTLRTTPDCSCHMECAMHAA